MHDQRKHNLSFITSEGFKQTFIKQGELEYYYIMLSSEKDHTDIEKGFQLFDTRIHNPIEQYSMANT